MKITVIGDSITYGYGCNNVWHSHFPDSFEVVNLGVSGCDLQRSTARNNSVYDRVTDIPLDSDIIYIFAGTNDFGHSLPLDTYKRDYNAVIYYIKNYIPNAKIYVMTPVRRVSNTLDKRGHTLKDFKDIVMNLKGVTHINLYDNVDLITDDLPDGLHPNDAGQLKIYNEVIKYGN